MTTKSQGIKRPPKSPMSIARSLKRTASRKRKDKLQLAKAALKKVFQRRQHDT